MRLHPMLPWPPAFEPVRKEEKSRKVKPSDLALFSSVVQPVPQRQTRQDDDGSESGGVDITV